jgi:DNA-binding MarR family transcriptional regulator
MTRPRPESGCPTTASGGRLSYAIFRLARAHRGLAGVYLRELGLHPGQELLLMELLDDDGRTQSELLASVGLDHSTVSKSLCRMQEAGLLTRVADERDRRVWRVWLTERGRAMREPLRAMWSRLEQVAGADLDPETTESFIEVAERIERAIASRGDRPAAPRSDKTKR